MVTIDKDKYIELLECENKDLKWKNERMQSILEAQAQLIDMYAKRISELEQCEKTIIKLGG